MTVVKLIILTFHLVNRVNVMPQEARTMNVMLPAEIVTASRMSKDKNVTDVSINFSAFRTAKVPLLHTYLVNYITFTNTFHRMSMLCPWNKAQHILR